MRSIFHWLTLLALLLAPLAAPAAAMAPVRSTADCEKMEMGGAKHSAPMTRHHASESCCVAVPTAIGAPPAALEAITPLGHLPFASSSVVFRLGTGPLSEDPPPRLS
jgi:hypothetical protein